VCVCVCVVVFRTRRIVCRGSYLHEAILLKEFFAEGEGEGVVVVVLFFFLSSLSVWGNRTLQAENGMSNLFFAIFYFFSFKHRMRFLCTAFPVKYTENGLCIKLFLVFMCSVGSLTTCVVLHFFFSNLGFLTAEASMFKLREKIAFNERLDRHLR
jgi:hypothetical protein